VLASEWNRMIVDLGLSVRDLRTTLGWSQDELAKRSVVSQGAISRLEAGGHSGIPFHTVVVVLRALALGATDLQTPLSTGVRALITFTQAFDVGITPSLDPGLVTLTRLYHRLPVPIRPALVRFVDSAVHLREVAA
jgi:transcriptional regulator with XRE-family HTH domain